MLRTGRPPVLGTPEARLQVVETLLTGGTLAEAAKEIGTTVRTIHRFASLNAWFEAILTAATARADRAVVLADLATWEAKEPLEQIEFEKPEPVPTRVRPEKLPSSYPPPARAAPDAVLAVDPDLVVDADRDLALPSHALTRVDGPNLPPLTVANVLLLIWQTANDPSHPACSAAMRKIGEIAVAPVLRAQAQREKVGKRGPKGAIDVEASELGASGSRPVFIRMPKNDTEARGRGPGGTE
jgi:hypothetical protein